MIRHPEWSDPETCPECEWNHAKAAREKERCQERIRILRRALFIACGGDQKKCLAALLEAEETLCKA